MNLHSLFVQLFMTALFSVFTLPVRLFCAENSIALQQRFELSDSIAILLPSDWEQIPSDILYKLFPDTIDFIYLEIPPHLYDYGFQLAATSDWLEYPYILISYNTEERQSENDYKKFAKSSLEMELALNSLSDKLDLFESISVSSMYFDTESHTIYSLVDILVGNDTVIAFNSMLLTETGYIGINTYFQKYQSPKYITLMQEIMQSLEIPESLRYKPSLADSFSILPKINLTVIAGYAIGFTLILLILNKVNRIWRFKKGKPPLT